MDERDDDGYGWSPAGERLPGLKSGRRQGRVNMIAGYRAQQLIAPIGESEQGGFIQREEHEDGLSSHYLVDSVHDPHRAIKANS